MMNPNPGHRPPAPGRGKHTAIRINFTTSLDLPPHTHTAGPVGDVLNADRDTLHVPDVKSLSDSRESGGVVVIPPQSNDQLVRKTVACG